MVVEDLELQNPESQYDCQRARQSEQRAGRKQLKQRGGLKRKVSLLSNVCGICVVCWPGFFKTYTIVYVAAKLVTTVPSTTPTASQWYNKMCFEDGHVTRNNRCTTPLGLGLDQVHHLENFPVQPTKNCMGQCERNTQQCGCLITVLVKMMTLKTKIVPSLFGKVSWLPLAATGRTF